MSSQPVVVRTYSGSRHHSRHSSGLTTPRYSNMNHQVPSALSTGLPGRSARLPSIDDFSFSAILRAVDPEIRDAIDAIAEICARSRLSLADEYDAHLPPQGEITGVGPGWAAGVGSLVGRGRISRVGQGWTAVENTLTAVPEASSSSERLAGESRGTGSSKRRSQSAYGSLKSVISGGSGRRKATEASLDSVPKTDSTSQGGSQRHRNTAWAVHASSEHHPVITVPLPQASKYLSLDTSSTIKDIPADLGCKPSPRPHTAIPKPAHSHHRNKSLTYPSSLRTRPNTLSSITSWLPWPRSSDVESSPHQDLTQAEARLREVLMVAQGPALGRGKAPANTAYPCS